MASRGSITRRKLLAVPAAAALSTGLAGRASAQGTLVDAARREGGVAWYSSFVEAQASRPMAAAFTRKYPGVPVQLVAGTATDLLTKLLGEMRANNLRGDVHHGGSSFGPLNKAGAVVPYISPEAAAYPAELKEPNGMWTADALYFLVPAINTDVVPAAQAPKTFQDLLDPRWRGKIAWTVQMTQGGPPGFIGTVLNSMGDEKGMEYLRRLAAQRIVNVPANQRVVLDQVISGEYPIALTTFINHSAISQEDGAPVRALTLDPVTETLDTLMLLKGPHPNAGKLFIDFCLSVEGQEVFRKAGYVPARPGVDALKKELKPEAGNFRAMILSPEEVEAKMPRWVAIYTELFK